MFQFLSMKVCSKGLNPIEYIVTITDKTAVKQIMISRYMLCGNKYLIIKGKMAAIIATGIILK